MVLGGGTTTLELTALRGPFLFFPLEGHCEQEVTVAGRLSRHGAGVRMSLVATSPAGLADAIAANLGALSGTETYPPKARPALPKSCSAWSDRARDTRTGSHRRPPPERRANSVPPPLR